MPESKELVTVSRADRRSNNCYHTEDCGRLPDYDVEMTKAEAEQMGLTECKYCSGKEHSGPDHSLYQNALAWEPDNE